MWIACVISVTYAVVGKPEFRMQSAASLAAKSAQPAVLLLAIIIRPSQHAWRAVGTVNGITSSEILPAHE